MPVNLSWGFWRRILKGNCEQWRIVETLHCITLPRRELTTGIDYYDCCYYCYHLFELVDVRWNVWWNVLIVPPRLRFVASLMTLFCFLNRFTNIACKCFGSPSLCGSCCQLITFVQLLAGIDDALQNSLKQPYYVPDSLTTCKASGTGQLWDYIQIKVTLWRDAVYDCTLEWCLWKIFYYNQPQ